MRMALEKIPINHFVMQRYGHHSVQKIVETWRIEPGEIINKLIEHFREMGIYEVAYGHEKLMMNTMLVHLKHSPEIMRMVARMRQEELRRVRNRHAD
jgi:hypothetical protein